MAKPESLKIRVPYWNKSAAGIAERRFDGRYSIEVEFGYKDKNGDLVRPHVYECLRSTALECPVETHKGTRLRIVPIWRMAVKQYRDGKGRAITNEQS